MGSGPALEGWTPAVPAPWLSTVTGKSLQHTQWGGVGWISSPNASFWGKIYRRPDLNFGE